MSNLLYNPLKRLLKHKAVGKAFKYGVRPPKITESPVRHFEKSEIYSLDDDMCSQFDAIGKLNMQLIFEVLHTALDTDLMQLQARKKLLSDSVYYTILPGEHYRILASFVKTLNPQTIVEIGTLTGMGTMSLNEYSCPQCKVYTFDIIPYNSRKTHIDDYLIKNGKITPIISNLSDAANFEEYSTLLAGADLIFLDAPKNVIFEDTFLTYLSQLNFRKRSILILDDIRLWNMLGIWRKIKSPKLDLISFAHWSGTGVVFINNKFEY